jgi:calcineurin-like phosphoesterase family protein
MWFTADTHFGHGNIIRYCSRPFASADEMDETMIANWNARVGKHDIVWHLGDFSFRCDPLSYFRRLNGRISFILGNHDKRSQLTRCTHNVMDVKMLRLDGQQVFLSHYGHRVWPTSFHGSLHLYGHSHGTLPPLGRSMDVGVDCHGFAPISWDTVKVQLLGEGT